MPPLRPAVETRATLTASGPPGARQIALILLLASTFAANHVAARIAFEHGASVLFAVSLRSAGTALVLLAWLLVLRQAILPDPALRAKAIAVGALVAVQSFFLYSAVQRMPVALALLVFNLFPIMIGFLSWWFGGDRPSRRAWIGMPIALGGLMLVLDAPARGLNAAAWEPGFVAGIGFGLGAALSMALIMVLTERWLKPVEGRVRALSTLSVVAFATVSTGIAVDGLHAPSDATGWFALAALTVLYGSAFSTMLVAVPRIGPVRAAPFFNFEPIAAMMMGWMILGQSVRVPQMLGAAVVIGALLLISLPARTRCKDQARNAPPLPQPSQRARRDR